MWGGKKKNNEEDQKNWLGDEKRDVRKERKNNRLVQNKISLHIEGRF